MAQDDLTADEEIRLRYRLDIQVFGVSESLRGRYFMDRLKEDARAGNLVAMVTLGLYLWPEPFDEDGDVQSAHEAEDQQRSIQLVTRAAQAGFSEAFAILAAQCTEVGNDAQAEFWANKAVVEFGSGLLFLIGLRHYRRNQPERANHWWKWGASLNNLQCMPAMALLSLDVENFRQAAYWYKKAFEAGDRSDETVLGLRHTRDRWV